MTAALARTRITENPHAGQGPVVLDIGGDVGALVVAMPETMAGVEIEIRSVGASRRQWPTGRTLASSVARLGAERYGAQCSPSCAKAGTSSASASAAGVQLDSRDIWR